MHKYPHSSTSWRGRYLNPSARDDAEQRMLPSAAEPEHLVRIERKGIGETHERGVGGGRRRRRICPRRLQCVAAGFVKTVDPDDVVEGAPERAPRCTRHKERHPPPRVAAAFACHRRRVVPKRRATSTMNYLEDRYASRTDQSTAGRPTQLLPDGHGGAAGLAEREV